MSIIFVEKFFSHYFLLTNQISLSDWVYFLRYWAIWVLQLFVSQFMTSQILKLTIAFSLIYCPTWPKKSGHKFKYVNRKEVFFYLFEGLSCKQIKPTFLEGESPTLKEILCSNTRYYCSSGFGQLSLLNISHCKVFIRKGHA